MEELLEKIISKIANEKDLDLGRIKGILILCMSDYDIRKKRNPNHQERRKHQ